MTEKQLNSKRIGGTIEFCIYKILSKVVSIVGILFTLFMISIVCYTYGYNYMASQYETGVLIDLNMKFIVTSLLIVWSALIFVKYNLLILIAKQRKYLKRLEVKMQEISYGKEN